MSVAQGAIAQRSLGRLVAGAGVAAVGALVLVGWILHLRVAVVLVPGGPPMAFNTALGLVLLGLGLALLAAGRHRLALGAAVPVVVLGCAVLLQFLASWPLGIDELFWSQTDMGGVLPGRMGPSTALALLLAAGALGTLAARRLSRATAAVCGTLLSGGVLVIALLGLVDTSLDVGNRYAWGRYASMELPTVACLTIVGVALLRTAIVRYQGTVRTARSWLPVLAGGGVLLLIVSWVAYRGLEQMLTAEQEAAHATERLALTQAFLAQLMELEASERGFVLTWNEGYLARAGELHGEVAAALERLEFLAADQADQIARVRALDQLVERKIAFSAQVIGLARREGPEVARAALATAEGLRLQAEMVAHVGGLVQEERRHVAALRTSTRETARQARAVIVFGTSMAGALVLIFVSWLAREHRRRAEAEEELREASEFNEAVLEASQHAIISTDLRGLIRTWNRAAETLLGWTAQEMIGHETLERIHEPAELMVRAAEAGLAPGMPVLLRQAQVEAKEQREWTYVRRDGRRVPVWVALSAVRGPWGEAVGLLAVVLDLTEWREVEGRLGKIAAQVPGMVYQLLRRADGTFCLPYVSEGVREIYGVAPAEVRTDAGAVFAKTHPEDLPRLLESIEESARTGERWQCEFRTQGAEGTLRWLQGSSTPEPEADGGVLWHGFITDITARKAAEAGLAEAVARFRAAAEASLGAFFILRPVADGAGRITDFTLLDTNAQGAHTLHAQHAKELTGRRVLELAPDWRGGALWATLVEVAERRTQLEDELLRREDGSPGRWQHVQAVPVGRDEIGVSMHDITERKRMEAALRESEERFREAFEFSGIGMALVAPDGRWLRVNRVLCEIVGYPETALLERTLEDITHPEDRGRDVEPLRALFAGVIRNHHQELRCVTREGGLVWVRLTRSVARDVAGRPEHVIAQIEDITLRRRAEAELKELAVRLQEKNRELQEFVYAASHDLQEPLRKIHAFADRLKKVAGASLGVQGSDYLERMTGATRRLQKLIDALLVYAQVTTRGGAFTSISLEEVVQGVCIDLELRLEQTGGRVETHDLPTVPADPVQMRQLFQNLIGNALKYHRAGVAPVITLTARAAPPAVPGGAAQWEITVADNGIGFEPQHAETIFGVFQRLHGRDAYEGTGVGLSICRRIVERHGGRIRAEGAPGEGARFIFTLPAEVSAMGGRETRGFGRELEVRL